MSCILSFVSIAEEVIILADGKPGILEQHGVDVYKLTMSGGLFSTGADGKPGTRVAFGQDVTNVIILDVTLELYGCSCPESGIIISNGLLSDFIHRSFDSINQPVHLTSVIDGNPAIPEALGQ